MSSQEAAFIVDAVEKKHSLLFSLCSASAPHRPQIGRAPDNIDSVRALPGSGAAAVRKPIRPTFQCADGTIHAGHIAQYAAHLQEEERAKNTIKKYVHDLHGLMAFLSGQPITKGAVIAWKEHLAEIYAPATVNSMLAAANGFFRFMDWPKLSVRR